MAYDISFNGIRTKEKGIAVTTRPQIPTPQKRVQFVEVAGMDGSLKVSDGTYEDIRLDVSLNFVRSPKWWHETAREVRNWLTGSGILRLDNLYGWHYRVKEASCSGIDNINKMGGQFTAQFICEPFQYHDGGDSFLSVDECLINPYYLCKPVYRIEGSGQKTLTVNGKTWTINVTGTHININTEKKLVYNDSMVNLRPSTSGEYEDLFLPNGVNTISISSGTLKIMPNWRSL